MSDESERREAVRNDWLSYPVAAKRRSVKASQRRKILAAQPTCYRCLTAPATEVDHVVAVCLGGTDQPHNLAGICRPCHLTKSAREANHVRWHVKKVPYRKGGEQ